MDAMQYSFHSFANVRISQEKKIFQQYYDKGSFQKGGGNSAIKMQTIPKKPLAKSKAQSNRCHSVVKC